MSLHDVDKNSADRGAPAPNRPDVVADDATMAHKTVSTQYRTGADATAGQVQMANKQLVANDGTANKALFGFQKGLGKWGMFVAVDGVDVTTNTDLSQFILNSAQDTFKIVDKGLIAAPDAPGFTAATGKFNSSNATKTIAHGLSYIPIVIGATNASNGGLLPLTVYGPIGATAGSIFWDYFNIYCDSINIYLTHTFVGFGGTAGVTFAASTGWGNVRYYLLQETAN